MILYYIILYYIILYHIMFYFIILYYTILYFMILYYMKCEEETGSPGTWLGLSYCWKSSLIGVAQLIEYHFEKRKILSLSSTLYIKKNVYFPKNPKNGFEFGPFKGMLSVKSNDNSYRTRQSMMRLSLPAVFLLQAFCVLSRFNLFID